ncbi:c-type cytochrome [Pontiella sp.]|uniref:c-type cytochrome n=1 Tax=Pontiella sp. TaxID=2837462 RepID=UPI0035663F2B
MIKDYRILAALAFLGLIVLGLSIKKSVDKDWIKHQKAYYKALDVEFPGPEIKQVNVKTPSGHALIDRCQTCHVGAGNPDAAGFPQPLAAHPPIVPGVAEDPHDFNKIGCSICHDGSSRDLDQHLAHGESHGWIKPLLGGANAQASCVRCHAMESGHLAGAELYEQGRTLFLEKACWGCHTIEGISSSSQAPELTDAGGKFTYEYLVESVVDPKANDEHSKMPLFDWAHDEEVVAALATYLKGQQKDRLRSAESAPIGYIKPKSELARIDEPSVAAGRSLFAGAPFEGSIAKGGCVNCHAIRNSDGDLAGGNIGPELTWTIRQRGRDYTKKHIVNARAHVADSIMPTFKDYNDAELESLVSFLSTLDYTLGDADGAKLYETHCVSCHGEDLNGRGRLAPMLDPLPRDFSKGRFVGAYESRFKTSIKEGVGGTDMPAWKNILSDEQIDRLIEFIKQKSHSAEKAYKRMQAEMPKIGDPERLDYKGKGTLLVAGDPKEGFEQFQKHCTSCHGKLANGKGPNAYALIHPLPRNLINGNFLNQPTVTDERLYQSILLGVPDTSMPGHDHLKDQTILDIIAFIRGNTEEAKP